MIKPTVGMNVHYYGATATEPAAAIITRVHSDVLVDVAVFLQAGSAAPVVWTCSELRLRQPDEGYPKGARAEWMPAQIEEAAFRRRIDEFLDQVDAKLDTMTNLCETGHVAFAENLAGLSKLVAQQASAIMDLSERLNALEPTPAEPTHSDTVRDDDSPGGANADATPTPESGALLGVDASAEADLQEDTRSHAQV